MDSNLSMPINDYRLLKGQLRCYSRNVYSDMKEGKVKSKIKYSKQI